MVIEDSREALCLIFFFHDGLPCFCRDVAVYALPGVNPSLNDSTQQFYIDVLGFEDDTSLRPNLPFNGAFVRAGPTQVCSMAPMVLRNSSIPYVVVVLPCTS